MESLSNNKIFCLYEKNSLIDPTAFGPKPSIFDKLSVFFEAKIKFLIFLNVDTEHESMYSSEILKTYTDGLVSSFVAKIKFIKDGLKDSKYLKGY